MKILVIKFRHIGDVLLTTPLIKNLRHYYPDAQIDALVYKGTEAMLSENKNLNNVIVYNKEKIKNGNFISRVANELKFANGLKKEKYDMIIQTTSGDRGILLAKYCKSKIVISYENDHKYLNKTITHMLPPYKGHIIDANLDCVRALNLKPIDKKVEIFFAQNSDKLIDLPEIFVHIHPMSRWMFKCINDENMANLIDFIEEELKIKTVITTDNSDKEKDKLKNILSITKSYPIIYSGKLNLKEVALLSKKSTLFLGVDTAIMHIAAANNIPVIAFFGASSAVHWGPWDNDLYNSTYQNKQINQGMGKHFIFQKEKNYIQYDKKMDKKLYEESQQMDKFDDKELNSIKEKIKEKLDKYIH